MSGKIYVIGLGPGQFEDMSHRAAMTIEFCDVIIGYTLYTELIKEYFPLKPIISTPMRREEERMRLAVENAEQGKNVAVVCSGDGGIYGMAGLAFEVSGENGPKVIVIPGITAASSGGAVVGAPLMNDFAVISLSDILTPWEQIERRICLAAAGDFSICLYNPASKTRSEHLRKACELMLKYKKGTTVCASVRNIGRTGEEYMLMTLTELMDYKADMVTTVFIGTEKTKIIQGKMITPRGYKNV